MKAYHNLKIIPNKTYATYANAEKAAINAIPEDNLYHQRFIITVDTQGRFFPIFLGQNAVQEGMHFHFNVL